MTNFAMRQTVRPSRHGEERKRGREAGRLRVNARPRRGPNPPGRLRNGGEGDRLNRRRSAGTRQTHGKAPSRRFQYADGKGTPGRGGAHGGPFPRVLRNAANGRDRDGAAGEIGTENQGRFRFTPWADCMKSNLPTPPEAEPTPARNVALNRKHALRCHICEYDGRRDDEARAACLSCPGLKNDATAGGVSWVSVDSVENPDEYLGALTRARALAHEPRGRVSALPPETEDAVLGLLYAIADLSCKEAVLFWGLLKGFPITQSAAYCGFSKQAAWRHVMAAIRRNPALAAIVPTARRANLKSRELKRIKAAAKGTGLSLPNDFRTAVLFESHTAAERVLGVKSGGAHGKALKDWAAENGAAVLCLVAPGGN